MVTTLQHLLDAALSLPEEERLLLAERLLVSLSTEPGLEAEHLATVRSRAAELNAGLVDAIPGDVALQAVRDALQARIPR